MYIRHLQRDWGGDTPKADDSTDRLHNCDRDIGEGGDPKISIINLTGGQVLCDYFGTESSKSQYPISTVLSFSGFGYGICPERTIG